MRDAAREALPETSATSTPAASPITPPTSPVSSTGGVPHYECPNKCAGGVGDGAGNCPVCGTAMAHNQAFHNQPASSPATTTPTSPIQTTTTTSTPPAGAAQNAAGVYHYTCPSGCAGGAAGAGNCATCGAALAHNQAFHDN